MLALLIPERWASSIGVNIRSSSASLSRSAKVLFIAITSFMDTIPHEFGGVKKNIEIKCGGVPYAQNKCS